MYRVELQNFEGPLDLLLFFIKRDELEIYDIPIAYITEQFLEFMHLMEELDLDLASEFIHMASMLMSIKAKMMLPRLEDDDEDDFISEEDPRYELVQRLLEYKRYKEMAGKMEDIDEESRKSYYRGYLDNDEVDPQPTGEALKDVTMFDLMAAYKKVLADIKRQNVVHRVEKVNTTVEEQTEYIFDTLHKRGRTSFKAICMELRNRTLVVVTFLAMLEMVKEHQIDLFIEDNEPEDFYLDLKPVDELLETAESPPERAFPEDYEPEESAEQSTEVSPDPASDDAE
ncbi:MAG: segregation and condensation protein A [Bacteroidota bacterium]